MQETRSRGLRRPLRIGIGISSTATAADRANNRVTTSQTRARAKSHRLNSCSAMRPRGAGQVQIRRVGPANRRDRNVPKEDLLQFEGLVREILPDARYRVELDNGHVLVAYTAGRMKKNRIKTLAGDRVTVEVSPYDLEKGRLIFRHKDERAGSMPRPAQRNQFRRR